MIFHFDKGALILPLRPSPKEVLRWAESLEALLTNPCKTVSFTRRVVSSFTVTTVTAVTGLRGSVI